MRRAAWKSIFWGGLTAGTLDIGAASLIYKASPIVILHSIASGLLGAASFSGGASSAVLGLFLQWGISLVIAAVFTVAAIRWPELCRRWIAGGLFHGVAIFLVMNYLVVPLSAAWPHHSMTIEGLLHRFPPAKFAENLVALLVFGVIVAFFAHRFLPAGRASDAAAAPAAQPR